MIESQEQKDLARVLRAALEPIAEQVAKVDGVLLEETGLRGLLVAEDLGGGGASAGDLVTVMAQIGHALAADAYLGADVIAARALEEVGTTAARDVLRTVLNNGRSVAFVGRPFQTTDVSLAPDGTLSGVVTGVLGRIDVDDLVVRAVDGAEPVLLVVERSAVGVAIEEAVALDLRRPQLEVALLDAQAAEVARGADVDSALELVLRDASLALAAEQAGGARRCLEDAVAYATDRYQFGRPIGSFQALKHRMALMFQRSHAAHIAVRKAADLVSAGDPAADEAVEVAAIYAGQAYVRNAADNIDVHGGIGFTVEVDCHLHYRRARAAAALFGGSQRMRERLAARLLDD